ITGATGTWADLSYDVNQLLTRVTWNDSRNANTYIKQYDLTYNTVVSNIGSYNRYFLATIAETSGCDHYPPYRFSYINNGRDLPSPGSNDVDFWGYYNGANNIADKIPTMYYYPLLPPAEQFLLYPIPGY
ncbi:MAG: hypothetical protein ACKOE6_04675, partial [Flammeovirgaceae bacterium]